MQGAQGRPGRPVAIFEGRALRALCNPPGAYWGVREEGFRSDNAADDHCFATCKVPQSRLAFAPLARPGSWTGS
jgi:hypothetical protein